MPRSPQISDHINYTIHVEFLVQSSLNNEGFTSCSYRDMSLVPSRLSSGQRVSLRAKDVPVESHGEENQNRQWQYFATYAIPTFCLLDIMAAFLGLDYSVPSALWLVIVCNIHHYLLPGSVLSPRARVEGSICIRIIGSNSFFSPVLVPAAAIWALYLTRISSKCCWQAWPINLWGVQLQLSLGVENLLFLLLHLICWMLNRY